MMTERQPHVLQGLVHRFGDNVDTDAIIPARYLNTSNAAELGLHCFEDVDPLFCKRIRLGDMIVAGDNFGCGSSREHAPIALRAAGISCVIAPTFARIFYRNAINIGLPILECAQAAAMLQAGDAIEVDLEVGTILDSRRGCTYQAEPFPPFMLEIIRCGGLIAKLQQDRQRLPAATRRTRGTDG